MIGIYKITNPNNKIYIGQSINIEKRIVRYKRLDCVKQSKLYRSLNKYGVESHKYEVVEECNISLLNQRERYYQDKYDCVNSGLNLIATKTNDRSGYASEETKSKLKAKVLTEEHKNKIRDWNYNIPEESRERYLKSVELRTGKKMVYVNYDSNPNRKIVYQYTKDGQFIKEWECIANASNSLKIQNSHISECANNKRKSAGGYKFSYINI